MKSSYRIEQMQEVIERWRERAEAAETDLARLQKPKCSTRTYAEPRPAAAVVPPEHLANIKFAADEAIKDPESIYAQEFFMLLDETFGKKGDYSTPVQAVAVSQLIEALSGQPQKLIVKLPSLKQTDSGERYVWSDGVYNYHQDVIEAIKAAGGEVE